MARRCPKCGNPRVISRDVTYGLPYYECTACHRTWDGSQLFYDNEKPFGHMLWDFANQEEETLEYKGEF